jgi:hypothetical protein
LIVVTGAGRCGSSMLMQTLYHLGVPMFGDPLGGEHNTLAPLDPTGIYARKIREKNPNGYWELDIEFVLDSVKKPFGMNGAGKALKALAATFPSIPKRNIDLAILCLRRDRNKQAQSMHELIQLEGKIADDSEQDLGHIGERIKAIQHWTVDDVRRNQNLALDVITKKLTEESILTHTVYFEDMKKKPKEEIESLVSSLNLSQRLYNLAEQETFCPKYSKKKIKRAIKNIIK